jgi:hypothetical protein
MFPYLGLAPGSVVEEGQCVVGAAVYYLDLLVLVEENVEEGQ